MSAHQGPNHKTALVTGSAGFIGYHVSRALLQAGYSVVGFDALTDYYDVQLKQRRHQRLLQNQNFRAVEERLESPGVLRDLVAETRPDVVIHLAAQAGVRYSIDEPRSYVDSNLVGTFELIEAARACPPKHLMLASTSSVYGANTQMPYAEHHKADLQMSFYAATKKATESMTHSYAHLFGIPTTMFRFFTVYGPWGRPDMAAFKFTRAILNGEPIDVYNHGEMSRDFTYIDDLAAAIAALADAVPTPPLESDTEGESENGVEDRDALGLSPVAPWRVVNIGNSQPVQLSAFIEAIEKAIGRRAERNHLPMQPGDVPATWADTNLLSRLIEVTPSTSVEVGVQRFVDWYRSYYNA
ncbi:MAG: SDR family NAD(P)-dependent oxidoreductase [Pseudomonadota bacterium]